MAIVVTTPIVSKPPRSRHAGGNSSGHAHSAPKPKAPAVAHLKAPPKSKAPSVPHVRAARAPAATRTTHARSQNPSLTPQEQTQGAIDNTNLANALGEPVVPQVTVQGSPGPGQPNPLNPNGGTETVYQIEQDANQAMQKQNLIAAVASGAQVDNATLQRFGLPTGRSSTPRVATPKVTTASTRHAAAPKPPATPRPPKVTAPLQLSDSGLLGHDSRVSGPGTLTPIPPVVRRRPR